MKRFDDDLVLQGFNLETLEKDPHSIFGLAADLTFNYFNPAWFVFARENNGEPAISERFGLGSHFADCIFGEARNFYVEAFERVLLTGTVWQHQYECSSPELFRLYHQSVYPLLDGRGLIIVNSLVTLHPHDPKSRVPHPPVTELYTQKTGLITQCSNCRRVQRSGKDAWDWVPDWVRNAPENTSHTICRLCYEYYYEVPYRLPRPDKA